LLVFKTIYFQPKLQFKIEPIDKYTYDKINGEEKGPNYKLGVRGSGMEKKYQHPSPFPVIFCLSGKQFCLVLVLQRGTW
jgi:hypothetical protein